MTRRERTPVLVARKQALSSASSSSSAYWLLFMTMSIMMIFTLYYPVGAFVVVGGTHRASPKAPTRTSASTSTSTSTSKTRLADSEGPMDQSPALDTTREERTTSSSSSSSSSALSLQAQAEELRQEAAALKAQIEQDQAHRLTQRTAKIDGWIDQLLIEFETDNGSTQLLKSMEDVVQTLQDERFSQEQINAIFNRICDTGNESRSNCSPLMELLVDAVGKMDAVDRAENPNKRWNGKVERVLRKRLFAMDWNVDFEDDSEDDSNSWMGR